VTAQKKGAVSDELMGQKWVMRVDVCETYTWSTKHNSAPVLNSLFVPVYGFVSASGTCVEFI
jgi:hypothetical protein